MSAVQSEGWRFSNRVLLPIVAAGIAAALLVTAVLVLATRESDRVAWERQTRLVSHILHDQIAKITHDQQSVSIWDDAVENTKNQFNTEWVEINLGVWMHDYFGHDEIFVLNDWNRPVYANVDGASTEVSTYWFGHQNIAPLVARLRKLLSDAKVGDPAGDPDTFSATDLVTVVGRPAIASVLPIVSDTGEIEQRPGSEFLHVSIRFLDASFLARLNEDFLVDGPRFSWKDDASDDEATFPLKSQSGNLLGHFIWTPERPGGRILLRTAPALAAALLVVGVIVALLTRRLRHACKLRMSLRRGNCRSMPLI